jgi:hypothetical protein
MPDTPIASLEIKTKPEYREIYEKINSLGDINSPDYIADEKARAEAVKNLKTPEYIDDTRRIEAIEKGTDDTPVPQSLVASHVDYMKLQDVPGVGSSSAEVMLYRVDNHEYDAWRGNVDVWGNQALKPVDQSRIPVWRIDVKYQKQDTEYQNILNRYGAGQSKEQKQATEAYLGSNPEYATARIQRDGYTMGFDDVSQWTEYNQLPDYGFWRERYRKDNPDFDTEAKNLQREHGQNPWADIDPAKIPSQPYDDIYEKYKPLFDQYENVQGTEAQRDEARKQIFSENPAFKEAHYRRKAYGQLFEEKYVENYVTYSLLTKAGYADERYLKAHPDFYQYAKNKLGWTEDLDFNKVPTEAVENLFNQYEKLPEGKRREDFRNQHRDLDAWLVLVGKVSKPIAEIYRERGLTPKEKFLDVATEQDVEFDRQVAELRKRLEALGR